MKRMSTVLCFGDSWTHGNSVALTRHFQTSGHHDVKVVSQDYWGSTAEQFANRKHLLPDAVTNSNADHVLLSMGGNDFKNIYWRQKRYIAPWTAVAEIEANIRIVLDALYEKHPKVKVVTYGYDFPGDITDFITGSFWNDAEKVTYTNRFLLLMYNYGGVRFINTSIMRLGGMYEKIAKDYTKKGFSMTYVPLWGTLQKAAIAEQKKSYKMGSPSPMQFMDDPIHANYEGFVHLLGEMYMNHFKDVFTIKPVETVAATSPPSKPESVSTC